MKFSKNGMKEVFELKTKSRKQIAIDLRDDIINDLPSWCSTFINESYVHKRVPKEYLLSSMNFAVSIAIGKTLYTHIGGYKNFANNYFLILGSRVQYKKSDIFKALRKMNEFEK